MQGILIVCIWRRRFLFIFAILFDSTFPAYTVSPAIEEIRFAKCILKRDKITKIVVVIHDVVFLSEKENEPRYL